MTTATDMHEFLTQYFHAALQETDLDIFTGLFTEDGVLEDPVGTPPLRGRAAIRSFLASGRALIEHAHTKILDVYVCGDEAAVRWSAEVRSVRGQTLRYDGIGIFTFAAPGQLRHVREYYDVAQLARLFGGG